MIKHMRRSLLVLVILGFGDVKGKKKVSFVLALVLKKTIKIS